MCLLASCIYLAQTKSTKETDANDQAPYHLLLLLLSQSPG